MAYGHAALQARTIEVQYFQASRACSRLAVTH
jgi:hypothetical protein